MDPTSLIGMLGAGGSFDPSLGMTMMQNPQAFGQVAAQAGIPPPALDAGNPPVPPLGASMDPWAGVRDPNAIESAPPADTAKPAATDNSKLLSTLRGVQAPPQPQLQKISTPAAPRPHSAISGNNLLPLLEAIGASAPTARHMSLGAVLGR